MTIVLADTATLLRCLEPLQERDHRAGSATTWKAEILAPTSLIAAVKPLPPKRLANELATAWIAGLLDVRAPSVFLVYDLDSRWPEEADPEVPLTLFASQFVDLPALNADWYDEKLAFVRSRAFADTFLLDLLIDNVDRVDRNLLYGAERYCAIDHDKAFGGENWSARQLEKPELPRPPTYLESNLVLLEDRRALVSAAEDWSAREIDLAPLEALCEWISLEETDSLIRFVEGRLRVLPLLLQAAFARSS